jgi:hypothetical protein
MLAVILPSSEIINYYHKYETVFSFVNGGVKELVKQLIMVSHGWYYDHFSDLQKTEQSVRLTNELVEQYENSVHRRYLENTHYQNMDVSRMVEQFIDEIEDAVNAMMNQYFAGVPYQVTSFAGWLGLEAVVYMSPVGGQSVQHPTPVHYSLF